MTVNSLSGQHGRLEKAIKRLQELGKVDEKHRGNALRTLASLRAYREVFEQLQRAGSMYFGFKSLRKNIDMVAEKLPSFGDVQAPVTNDVPDALMLSTVWPLLQFVLRQLLSNAAAAAQQVGGEVRVFAVVETNAKTSYCRICVTNPGTLPEPIRNSILQRRPVLRPDGQYGIGLLVAGEVLTMLSGNLQYPKTDPKARVVQAAAVLTLNGD